VSRARHVGRGGGSRLPPDGSGKNRGMEREVQHEPQVLEGDDLIPHQPADRDEYTPGEPYGRARVALWIALLIVLGFVAAIVIYAIAT
jgi:hypothetical protein